MVNKKKKGKNAIVLLSHNLLEHQIEELERKWNVGNIIYLPEELQKRWSNVDPELEFYNKDSLIDIKRIINVPARGIGKVTIAKIFSGETNTLPKKTLEKIDSFYKLIDVK